MGAAASISQEEASYYPQYQMLGGSFKFSELKDAEGKVSLDMVQDPYLLYGGAYENDPKDALGFKYVQFTKYPNFTSDHTSALASILTRNLFDKLQMQKTASGYTLSNVIQAGVVTPALSVGVSAGDEECFTTFEPLFYPIIRLIHKHEPNDSEQLFDLNCDDMTDLAESSQSKYLRSWKITGRRNISGMLFPSGTNIDDRSEVENIFRAYITNNLNGEYYNIECMNEEKRQWAKSEGFNLDIPKPGEHVMSSGGARSWPMSRGLYHQKQDKSKMRVWVNYEDHIRFESDSGDICHAFKQYVDFHCNLNEYLKSIGKKFAVDVNLGYLGSNLAYLGTAMTISAEVSLPKLCSDSELLKYVIAWTGLELKEGSATDTINVTSTRYLGLTERSSLQLFISNVKTVFSIEERLEGGVLASDIYAEMSANGCQGSLASYSSPLVVNVTSPQKGSVHHSKVIMVAASPKSRSSRSSKEHMSPKAIAVAVSPKPLVISAATDTTGSPKTDKNTVQPHKSPRKVTVAATQEVDSSSTETPDSNNAQTELKKTPMKPSFMSGKLNMKLNIQIDELKFPE